MNPQLKKGVLELCVLSQLTKEDKYGYELTDAIILCIFSLLLL